MINLETNINHKSPTVAILLGLTTSILTPSKDDKYAFPFLSLKYVLPVVGLYPTMLWMYFGCSAIFWCSLQLIKQITHESRELPDPCWSSKPTQLEDDKAELWTCDPELFCWVPSNTWRSHMYTRSWVVSTDQCLYSTESVLAMVASAGVHVEYLDLWGLEFALFGSVRV